MTRDTALGGKGAPPSHAAARLLYAMTPATAQPAPATGPQVHLRLVGPPALLAGARVHPLERREAALLAMLLLEGPLTRSAAAARIWPDADRVRSRNSLRQRLYKLRGAAGTDVVGTGDPLAPAPGVSHDLADLAGRLAADPAALRGDLLDGLDYADCGDLAQWVHEAREQWRAARRRALEEAAEALEAVSEADRALALARRLVADYPLHEPGHRRLMRLHYRRGEGAVAMAVYQALVDRLMDELGLGPDPETRALARLVAAGEDAAPRDPARSVSLLRPPRLVGRQAALDAMGAAWSAGRPVLVAGEAGIGKSRLLAEFLRAGGGTPVSARPGDAGVPYALLARLVAAQADTLANRVEAWCREELARVCPSLGPAAAAPLAPLRLHGAFAHWLQALPPGSTVTVDDLQFADPASLECLAACLGTEGGPRWLLGSRVAEWPHAEGADLPPGERVLLGPLDLAATRELVDSLQLEGVAGAPWAEALHRRTGGNPLFMLETLRMALARGGADLAGLGLALPAPLAELLQRRLAALPAPALRLARVAALAGDDFDADVAARVLEVHAVDLADPWAELERAQVLVGRSFAHDLMQEAVAAGLPAPVAEALHGRLAEALAARGRAPARVAAHLAAAGRWPEAAQAWRDAAFDARRAARVADEEGFWLRAVEACERCADHEGRVAALASLVQTALKRNDGATALERSERLAALARTDRERMLSQDMRGDAANFLHDYAGALQAGEAALALAQSLGDEAALFNARRKVAGGLAGQGRTDEALAVHEQMLAYAEGRERDRNVVTFLADRAFVLEASGRPLAAAAGYRRVIEHALALGEKSIAQVAAANLAVSLHRRGLGTEALAAAETNLRLLAELEIAEEDGWSDRVVRAGMLRDAGRLGEALAELEHCVPRLAARSNGYWAQLGVDQLALTWLRLGRPERAQALLASPTADMLATSRVTHELVHGVAARYAGRADAAGAARLMAAAQEAGSWQQRATARNAAALAVAPAQGRAWADEVVAEALRREATGQRLSAGVVAAACGDAEPEALAELLDLAEGHDPFLLYKPEAWWLLLRAAEGMPADRPVAESMWLPPAAAPAGTRAEIARRALRAATAWIDAAAATLPPLLRESFLARNPVNAALLRRSGR